MIIDDNMKNVLLEAQKMFKLNSGLSPLMFMKIKNEKHLNIEVVDMSSEKTTNEACNKYKNMIESGELLEYVFMMEKQRKNEYWYLMVIKANVDKELQCICEIEMEDSEYKFSDWTIYDCSNIEGRKNSLNNLFGQVYCNYN